MKRIILSLVALLSLGASSVAYAGKEETLNDLRQTYFLDLTKSIRTLAEQSAGNLNAELYKGIDDFLDDLRNNVKLCPQDEQESFDGADVDSFKEGLASLGNYYVNEGLSLLDSFSTLPEQMILLRLVMATYEEMDSALQEETRHQTSKPQSTICRDPMPKKTSSNSSSTKSSSQKTNSNSF